MASDTRVRITKQMIKESFIELLKTNSLSKISVTQICKKAEINRVTFYRYYRDVFDLYEKTVDELVEESSGSMMKINSRKDLKKVLEITLTGIYEQIDRYDILFSEHIDGYHLSRSIECCMSKISTLDLPGLSVPEEQRELLRAFLSCGGGGVLATCINDGMKQSPKEVANLLYSYIMQILNLYQTK